MSYQALARKWRPRSFDTIVGQEHVVRALVNAFERDRLHHAYLFSGTRGVGKTTIARVFAKGLNCEHGPTARPCGECGACREIDEGRHIDLIEVDAASRARVEETRDLLDNVQYAPVRSRFKVYLIDEVHMFSRHSFNALLKTLEEPPPHVKFLLATTDPQRLPVTVLSRCLQFGLRRLGVDEIAEELARISREEAIEADAAALRVLGRAADGSMRDALSLLDQAAAYGAGRIAAADVRALVGTVGRDRLFALLDAVASSDAAAMIVALDRLAGEAADFEMLLGEIVDAFGRMAALQVVPAGREDDEELDALRALAARISPEALQLHYQIGIMGRRDLPWAPHPRVGFEMTMLRMVAFAPASGAAPASEQGVPVPEAAPVVAPAPAAARESETATGPPPGEDAYPLAAVETPEPSDPALRVPPPPEPEPVVREDAEGLLSPSRWADLCARLALNGIAGQLAANCVVRGHTESTIDLVLSPEREQLLTSGTRSKLESALGDYFGRPIRLRVDVARRSEESPAERDAREESERVERASRELREVPDYQDLLTRFEGNTRSIQPPD